MHYWIDSGQLERDLDAASIHYPPRPTQLDAYHALIRQRLETYPELTAVRLFEEVRAAGSPGSLTQLKVFVRQVRPVPPPEAIVRFETPPGHQGQVDFAEVRLPWGKRFAVMFVLGYSRLLWVQFFPRQTMRTLMTGLEEAFAFCGGVPHELLFDQLKAVILEDRRPAGGCVLENPEFLRFAAHWGFRSRACRPYRAQTNAMAESFFATLECELLDRERFRSPTEARPAIFQFIEGWYNPHRRHSALGQRSPVTYERLLSAAA